MKILTKKEIMIFITFFIVYSFFVHWVGWVENSQFDLTRSIVEEGRFEIDSYANNTGDRAVYGEHYYSNKVPGVSFLSVPIYVGWKLIYNSIILNSFMENSRINNYIINTFSGVPIVTYINPGFFVLTSMILVTIFTSSLFSALTVVLIYKISRYFTRNEKHRLLITIIYGLGTLAFPYATVFYTHATGTFFAFLAFYLLFKIKKEKIEDNKYLFLAGLSIGFAVVSDYSVTLIFLGLLLLTNSFRRYKLFLFILGSLVGIIPLLLYNFFIFGNPLELTINYSDSNIFPPITQVTLPNLYIILRLLVFPYRGLFFYYPILALSLVGLFYMYKKYKTESLFISFIFISFLIAFSMLFVWWGGTAFGPRYLLPVIPFLMIPLLYAFEKTNFKIISFLLLISIFTNVLGLQTWENLIVEPNDIKISSEYKERVNTLQLLNNPLYDYYLPLFIENGPRSRIFENLISGDYNVDIRDNPLSKMEAFPKSRIPLFSLPFLGIVFLKLRFLSLLPLAIILFLIWRREISAIFRTYLPEKQRLLILFFVPIVFIIFFVGTTKDPMYDKNWYMDELHENITYNFMSQNATILMFNWDEYPTRLNFIVNSYYKLRTLDVFVNDGVIGSYSVATTGNKFATPLVYLKPGMNTIKFHSKEGCDFVFEIADNTDPRCLSFAFSNISKEIVKDVIIQTDVMHENNWYDVEELSGHSWRWMSQNATISVFNTGAETKDASLNFTAWSYYKPRTLDVLVNGQHLASYVIPKDRKENITLDLQLEPEDNTILFQSKEGCDVPEEKERSGDGRCLSFAFADVEPTKINLLQVFFDSMKGQDYLIIFVIIMSIVFLSISKMDAYTAATSKFHRHLLIISIYFILTMLMTYPVVLSFGTRIAGDGGDGWQNIWNLWWVKKSLLSPELNLHYTYYQFYPTGTSLAFHTLTLFNSILSVPLQYFFNLVTAYNILLLMSFVLAGWGMFLLVNYLVGDKGVAFISGFAFAFSPYHFAQALGHLNLASIQWIPLYVLFLIRMTKEKGKNNSILAGFFLVLISLSDWQYMVYSLIFTLFYLAYNSGKIFNRIFATRFILFLSVFAVSVLPFSYPLITEFFSSSYMKSSLSFGFSLVRINYYLTPSQLHPVFGDFVKGRGVYPPNLSDSTVFIGYTILLIAALSLATNFQRVKFWFYSALMFFVLSLHPQMVVFGKSVVSPLYFLFHEFFPFFSVITNTGRFSLMVLFSVIVIFAFGLKELTKDFERSSNKFLNRKTILLITSFLVAFEFISLPYPTTNANVPDFLYGMSEDNNTYTVIDIPPLSNSPALYLQTVHQKNILGGYVSRTSPSSLEQLEEINQKLNSKDVESVFSIIEKHNIKYAILYKQRSSDNNIDLRDFLTLIPTFKAYENDEIVIYEIRRMG